VVPKALFLIAVIYLVAALVGLGIGHLVGTQHPIIVVALADVTATIVVFLFSYLLGNSSIYDPYWSVAPVLIALYWALIGRATGANPTRQVVVLILVGTWAVRLTWNWVRQWDGLKHEDWRYVDLRARYGRAYWPVSLTGIHMMPTLIVFLGCLALFPALSIGMRPFGIPDLAAVLVTGGAIWIEAQADRELRRHRASNENAGKVLDTGLWTYSRHPNYFGEMTFWWGLYLFALAADPRYWWTIVGPVSITLLFLYVSIPMIERRMLARRPDYIKQIGTTSRVIPWSPRNVSQNRANTPE
jgi:steroid 5-alpha reductase family enzyme